MPQEPPCPSSVLDLARWLAGSARTALAPVDIVAGCCDRLRLAGVPLWRVRVGQRLANPLIGVWGVKWVRGAGAEEYTVPRRILATGSYTGSPFEHVNRTRTSFRRSLRHLDPSRDHKVLFEVAAEGGTDYLAVPIMYGDGSVQGASFATDEVRGFSPEDVAFVEEVGPFLAAALEPAAMRRSGESLLRTYLGDGPSRRVAAGAIRRGDRFQIGAAVLLTDLRGYTALSQQLAPDEFLDHLDRYLEVVVEACRAVEAALARAAGMDNLQFVGCLHIGPVTYGNIGSLDRLDFTVVGPTVNLLSRLEALAKSTSRAVVCSQEVAALLPSAATSALGRFALKGIPNEQMVFSLSGSGHSE